MEGRLEAYYVSRQPLLEQRNECTEKRNLSFIVVLQPHFARRAARSSRHDNFVTKTTCMKHANNVQKAHKQHGKLSSKTQYYSPRSFFSNWVIRFLQSLQKARVPFFAATGIVHVGSISSHR